MFSTIPSQLCDAVLVATGKAMIYGHEDWMPADNDECKDAILAFAKNLTIDQLPK